MFKYKKIVGGAFLLFNFYFLIGISAQPKTDSITKTAVANPKLIIAFAAYKNGSKISVANFKNLLKTSPTLVLKDEKGINYTVTSFEFTWRQKSIDDDVQTGKPKINYTTVGQKFKGNKLDEDWIKEITELLNAGDQLNFNTILYFDAKKNKTFLAPGLKIEITN